MAGRRSQDDEFVLGLDLDGVCADFYGRMREIVAELKEVEPRELTPHVSFGLGEWDLDEEYKDIHRFAVTQRDLFASMRPIPGAVPALRRLSNEGVHIRIITHRLFISHFHRTAVTQTTAWLDQHGFPYFDLCFMREKGHVDADIYVEDTESNIVDLQRRGKPVIAFTNSANVDMDPPPLLRAQGWAQAESMIRDAYRRHLNRGRGPVE